MAWNKSNKESVDFLVLLHKDQYFVPRLGDIDYEITAEEMVNLYPDNVFSELYIHGCKKILVWDLAQSLLDRIQKDFPELLDKYNSNKVVKSK